MYEFLSIVLIIFGVLQIILFFKMWGMTSDVDKIKDKIEQQPKSEDAVIIEAQLKTLKGDKEEAFVLYQKAFYLSVIELYEKTIGIYGEEEDYQSKHEYYENQYSTIVKYYSKRVSKLGGFNLEIEKYNSFKKVDAMICKL